jgi:hypothetical protein
MANLKPNYQIGDGIAFKKMDQTAAQTWISLPPEYL